MSEVTPASLRGAVDLSGLVNRPAAGESASDAPTAAPTGLVIDGTDTNFSQFLDLSTTVPVIVDLWAEWCGPCKQLSPILEKIVREYAGRFVLVKVDVDANPQLSQAFQAQSIPTVAALIGGRPVALFTGAIPEQQVREVFEQVLALAEQNGVTGRVPVGADGEKDPEPEEEQEPEPEPLPPLHQEAYDAIDAGDYGAAISAFTTAIAQDPRDALAVAGLAQVKLLARVVNANADELRSAAAAAPSDVDAQLAVADLDLSGGHVDDALGRPLDAFPRLDASGKNAVRERLVDYFQIIGVDDPRVIRARGRLTGLLF